MVQAFKQSLQENKPPETLSELQTGLWHAAKGNWVAAHNIAQAHEGEKEFDHLHAYLHRVEGDEWNANYWYRRAGVAMPNHSYDEEIESLLTSYL
ncbi:hypothetical protein [Niabella ginsengisoli]|uniref:Uncharacterized protein n=1 Tax=Niabella ginsengisoli TaxID=522298 RepID=A0ABS9SQ65_9BACT|nr:hypothetical protein [Niabella ginsengisoli]MCH5600520.1 hypothetical protein [Niabella ginsengisoli]